MAASTETAAEGPVEALDEGIELEDVGDSVEVVIVEPGHEDADVEYRPPPHAVDDGETGPLHGTQSGTSQHARVTDSEDAEAPGANDAQGSAVTPSCALDLVPSPALIPAEVTAPMSETMESASGTPSPDWYSALTEKAGYIVVHVQVDHVDAHPCNPRIGGLRDDVVKAIEVSLRQRGGFAEFHAPIGRSRPDGRVETIKGHHQVEAAKRAGLKKIPMWIVEEMSDQEALELLAFTNVQEELTPLEIALHSYAVIERAPGRKGMGLKHCAERMGISAPHLSRYRLGAEVFQAIRPAACDNVVKGCRDRAEHLAEIRKAPSGRWLDLAESCIGGNWSIKKTKEAVAEATASPDGEEATECEEAETVPVAKEGETPDGMDRAESVGRDHHEETKNAEAEVEPGLAHHEPLSITHAPEDSELRANELSITDVANAPGAAVTGPSERTDASGFDASLEVQEHVDEPLAAGERIEQPEAVTVVSDTAHHDAPIDTADSDRKIRSQIFVAFGELHNARGRLAATPPVDLGSEDRRKAEALFVDLTKHVERHLQYRSRATAAKGPRDGSDAVLVQVVEAVLQVVVAVSGLAGRLVEADLLGERNGVVEVLLVLDQKHGSRGELGADAGRRSELDRGGPGADVGLGRNSQIRRPTSRRTSPSHAPRPAAGGRTGSRSETSRTRRRW